MSIESYVDTVIMPHIREVVLADVKRITQVQSTNTGHSAISKNLQGKDGMAPKDILNIVVDNPESFAVRSDDMDSSLMISSGGTKEDGGWRFSKTNWDYVLNVLKNNNFGYVVKNTLHRADKPVAQPTSRMTPREREAEKRRVRKNPVKIGDNRWMYADTRLVLSNTPDAKGIIIGMLIKDGSVAPLTKKAMEYCEENKLRYAHSVPHSLAPSTTNDDEDVPDSAVESSLPNTADETLPGEDDETPDDINYID
uniref:Uncharacterized protein n=1 Tax=viral metagenome TaxID=1070528 RepID=A0A6C0M087_9ZZZZ